jgi:uncharacterized protein
MAEFVAAMEAGDLDRVRELVTANPLAPVTPGSDGLSPVMWARYRDRLDLLEVLLAGDPALTIHEAAAVGRTARVRELLHEDAALVSSWSPDGFTPVHLAVFFGHPEVARILLDAGAAVSAVSRNGMAVQPLHSATAGRDVATVEALLDAGAPVDAVSHGGFTALHDAAQNGDRGIVEVLLARGADVTMRDDRGRTARDLAEENGHTEVARAIEEAG